MGEKNDLIKKLKEFKHAVNKEVPVKRMLFFGSRARGKAKTWSDVDLLVVSNKFRQKKSYKRARKLYDYWNIDHPVDFLCFTPEEFNRMKNRFTVVSEAVEHGIEI